MLSSKDIFPAGQRRTAKRDVRLHEAWAAFRAGSASREDAELVLSDLAEFSEYFYVADSTATGDQLMRREGRREVMARILFLLDLPASFMTEVRQAALDELLVTQQETNLDG